MGVEFVGVELELRGEEAVYSDLQKIDRLLNSLGGRKKVDAGLQSLKRDILAATGELQKFERKQKSIQKGFKSGSINKTDFWTKQLDEASRGAEKTRRHLQDLRQTEREVNLATRQMGDTFKQTFNRLSSGLTHAGSKMQTLGNALQKLTSPFERFTTGLIMGAGYKALGKLTEGFESGFSRYDTMKKYPKLMAEYSTEAYTAEQSVEDLNKSVEGLPIALDDAVSLAQRYTLSLGDMERGTQLAIATNNAFLASMATETQRYQGMMQMQDLLNGKDLNSREWMSLGASMGKAINEIGKEFGYTDKNMGEFRQELYAGNIATKDFLNALQKVGTGKGSLVALARESMDTWEAFFSRIGTAGSRLVYGALQSLDAISQKMTGMDVNQLLDNKVIPSIDNATASIKKWINAHPEEIKSFFKDLSSIDFKGFVKGLAEGMGEMAKAIQSFAKFASGKDLSGIGKMMIRLNMAGKFLTVFGGLVKGLSHPLAGIASVFIRGGRSFKRGGFMGMLGDLIAGESLSSLGDAEKKIDTAAPMMGKFSGKLSKFFTGWAQVATMIGGSALVGAVSFKAFKSVFKDIKEIGDIIGDTDWGNASKGLIGIGGFLTAFLSVSKLFSGKGGLLALKGGGILAGLTAIFAGTFWADMAMIKRGFKALSDATEYMISATENLGKIKSVGNFTEIRKNIANAVGVFNNIIPLLQPQRNTPVSGEGTGGLKQLGKNVVKSIENLSESLRLIEQSVDAINKINGMSLDTSNIETMMTNLSTAMDQVGGLYDMLPESITTGDAIWKGENINQSLTNIQNIFSKLVGEGGILSQIPRITQQMSGLQRSGNLETLKSKMQAFGEAFKNIWDDLNIGISSGDTNVTQLTNLETALGKVKSIINRVNAIGGMRINRNGTANIRSALDSIKNAFSGANVAGITGQINAFVESVKTALQSLKDLNEEIQINVKVKLSPAFESSVKATIRQINNGKKRIRATRTAVSFTIPVRVTFSVSTNLGSALGVIASARNRLSNAQTSVTNNGGGGRGYQGQATGGMIYRAKGGSIGFPGRPRGVDKVPVWAQAGEFMHRKQAVNLFGIDFMRKVNNLDMRGAMHELMTRAGNIANVGKNTVINNYYNNNQKVTQNINTQSSDFAFRSASRFAGAFK